MNPLQIGDRAPLFTLLNQQNKSVSLSEFHGKSRVLLYFYPKASTPGCTTQACCLRNSTEEFLQHNTIVLGVSPDAPARLQKFIEKYDLNFDLLADENHSVAEQYGVWGMKKFMGREFMGILRTSFLIDEKGMIKYIMHKVNTKMHDQDILNVLRTGI